MSARRDFDRYANSLTPRSNVSNNSSATATASFPVFGLATAVLFVLKVAGMNGASWGLASIPWWLVFAPVLVGIAIFLTFLVVIIVLAILSSR